MKVILIDEDAFFELFERVLDHVETKLEHQEQNNWLTPSQAMKKLNITSKTTLQRYRDEGKVRYTKIGRKNILYDPKSIDDFLNRHANETF
jgi:rRNA-processing protein FCF1